MTPENKRHRSIPDWAQRERGHDMAWIGENFDIFWSAATFAFEKRGVELFLWTPYHNSAEDKNSKSWCTYKDWGDKHGKVTQFHGLSKDKGK